MGFIKAAKALINSKILIIKQISKHEQMKNLVLLITILLLPYLSYSQCCAAGNPLSVDGSEQGGKNSLRVYSMYKHSFSDTYYEGSQKSEYEYKNTYFDFALFGLSYGITDKLNIKAEVGYFFTKSEKFVLTDLDRHAFGLGDASVSAAYRIYQSKDQSFRLTPSIGLKVPVGIFDQVYNNIVLPIDLQPSSGSYRFNPGISVSKTFSRRFSVYSAASVDFAQAIRTKRTKNYKYGNLYVVSVFGTYKINRWLSGIVQLREEIREKANNDGTILDATGGNVLFVVPQLRASLNEWSISAMIDLPLYKNLNSPGYPQLSNKYAYTVNLSRTIKLTKPKIPVVNTEIENLQEISFFVDGTCEMCKERILGIAFKARNVEWAEWDVDAKILRLKCKDEIDLEKLKSKLAKAGHDTDTVKASEKAYSNLHECCKYREVYH